MKEEFVDTKNLFVSSLGKYNKDTDTLEQTNDYIITYKNGSEYIDALTGSRYFSLDYYKTLGMSINNSLIIMDIKPIDLYMKYVRNTISTSELNTIFNYINSEYHNFYAKEYIPRDELLAKFYDLSLRIKHINIDDYNRERIEGRIANLCKSYVCNMSVVVNDKNETHKQMTKKLYKEKLKDLEADIERYKDLDMSDLEEEERIVERVLK